MNDLMNHVGLSLNLGMASADLYLSCPGWKKDHLREQSDSLDYPTIFGLGNTNGVRNVLSGFYLLYLTIIAQKQQIGRSLSERG